MRKYGLLLLFTSLVWWDTVQGLKAESPATGNAKVPVIRRRKTTPATNVDNPTGKEHDSSEGIPESQKTGNGDKKEGDEKPMTQANNGDDADLSRRNRTEPEPTRKSNGTNIVHVNKSLSSVTVTEKNPADGDDAVPSLPKIGTGTKTNPAPAGETINSIVNAGEMPNDDNKTKRLQDTSNTGKNGNTSNVNLAHDLDSTSVIEREDPGKNLSKSKNDELSMKLPPSVNASSVSQADVSLVAPTGVVVTDKAAKREESSETKDADQRGEKSDTKDADKLGEKSDIKDADKLGEKSDTKDADKLGEKSDTKDADKLGEKSDTKDADKLGEKSDIKDADKLGEKSDTKDADKLGEKSDTKDADKLGEKSDTKDADKLGEKSDTKDADKLGEKSDTKDADKLREKFDIKDADKLGEKSDIKDADKLGEKSDIKDADKLGEKSDTKDADKLGEKSDTKDADKLGEKSDTKDADKLGEKSDIKDADKLGEKSDTKDADKLGEKSDIKDADKLGEKSDTKDADKLGEKSDIKDADKLEEKSDTKDADSVGVGEKSGTKDADKLGDASRHKDANISAGGATAVDRNATEQVIAKLPAQSNSSRNHSLSAPAGKTEPASEPASAVKLTTIKIQTEESQLVKTTSTTTSSPREEEESKIIMKSTSVKTDMPPVVDEKTTPTSTTVQKPVRPSGDVDDGSDKSKELDEAIDIDATQSPNGKVPDFNDDEDDYPDSENTDVDADKDTKVDVAANVDVSDKVQRPVEGDVKKTVPAGKPSVVSSLKEPEPSSSSFMIYFLVIAAMIVSMYIIYHNRQKLKGLLIEGRQSMNRRQTQRGTYSKLSNKADDVLPTPTYSESIKTYVY